jgi:hypothetical protein
MVRGWRSLVLIGAWCRCRRSSRKVGVRVLAWASVSAVCVVVLGEVLVVVVVAHLSPAHGIFCPMILNLGGRL